MCRRCLYPPVTPRAVHEIKREIQQVEGRSFRALTAEEYLIDMHVLDVLNRELERARASKKAQSIVRAMR